MVPVSVHDHLRPRRAVDDVYDVLDHVRPDDSTCVVDAHQTRRGAATSVEDIA